MKSTFFVTRFFIIGTGLFATPDKDETKVETFAELFFRNSNFTIDGVPLALRAIERRGDIVMGKLARQKSVEIHLPTKDDIKQEETENWPPAHFIVSLAHR